MSKTPPLPAVTADGYLMSRVGQQARGLIMVTFEMIGGVDRMAQWADENPGEFYTKLFPKVVTRESDVNHTVGIDQHLEELDREDFIDADYEVVGDEE